MEKMSDENTEEVKVLESEIERLQAEVESLQHQQQEINKDITFHYSQQMENALVFMCGQRQEGGKEMVMSRLKEELEELEEDMKLQTEINGITLNSCTTKTLQNSGRKLVQQLSLSGNCSELVFQVEFQLSEIKDSERSKRTIGDLNVVLDSSDLQNFSSFLSRCIFCPYDRNLPESAWSVSESAAKSRSLISEARPHLDCVAQSEEFGKQQMEKYLR
ncbi:centromere protein P [Pundamilia nyererei]|uniref:Centromere protein P n=1 Tax=Pundamilia nyererei TaxID=303518 RepID=A0A9Y3R3E7_9CICH|nr:PREDICTED: centromere protein P [Pundamilia nyererei]